MSALTKGQQRFAGDLSHETGLDPRVIGAWLLAEENGSAAASYEHRGYHNWLNIARTGSGDAHGAHSNVWANPSSAAKATAEWLRGQGPITREYGHAAPGIKAILNTAGKGAEAQIRAISGSGWASSGYNGGATLRSLVHTIGNTRFPADATAAPPAGKVVPGRLSVQTASSPGEAAPGALSALLEALKARSGPQYLGSPKKPGAAQGTKTPVGLPEQAQPDVQALAEQLVAGQPRTVQTQVSSSGAHRLPSGAPAPAGHGVTSLKGVVDFGGKKVAAWIAPILHYAQEHGWKGNITSGYRSLAEQERIYNSGVRPAARPGTSNHEFDVFPGGAIDVENAPALSRIIQHSPYNGLLQWAGSKDPVHFSHPHNGSY